MRVFLLALILFLVIDIPYLTFVSGDFYKNLVKNIQGSDLKIKYGGAILAYLIMGIAVKYLIIDRSKSREDVVKNAFLTALVGYGLYNFTNYAIFKNYTFYAAMRDLIWGIILFTTVSLIIYAIQ